MAAEAGAGVSSRTHLIRNAALLRESMERVLRILQAGDRDRARRHGISPSQGQALLALSRSGPLTVTGLGEHLHLEKSTASRLAKGLLKRGFVRKRSPASDDRKVILQVTEQGIRLSRRILNDLSEEYVALLGSMDPEVGESLPRLLALLAQGMAAGAPPTHDTG